MYEVIHFIAYTLLIGVDVVILYEATPVPYESALKQIFGKRVHLYSFTWPQRSNYSFPQRGSQLAQMNSCYYRNKHYFDYMIFIDVDEYLYFDNNSTRELPQTHVNSVVLLTYHLYHLTPLLEYCLKHPHVWTRSPIFGSFIHIPYAYVYICSHMHSYVLHMLSYGLTGLQPDFI